MNVYYIEYPRDFANEYTIFVAEQGSEEEQALLEKRAGIKRITRKEAIKLGVRRVRQSPDHEQFYGGFVMPADDNWLRGKSASEVIANAKRATRHCVEGKMVWPS